MTYTDQEWAEEAQQPAEEGYKVTARVWGVGQGQHGHHHGEGEGGEGYGLCEDGEWSLQRQCICEQWSDIVNDQRIMCIIQHRCKHCSG